VSSLTSADNFNAGASPSEKRKVAGPGPRLLAVFVYSLRTTER
jgi:hypothetical protein